MEVPETLLVAELLLIQAERTETPGPKISTPAPIEGKN